VTREGEETTMRGKGRHDPCVLPRAVPMVEAMVALTLVDALMTHVAQCGPLAPPVSTAAFNELGEKLAEVPEKE
jgi:chorismate synthase